MKQTLLLSVAFGGLCLMVGCGPSTPTSYTVTGELPDSTLNGGMAILRHLSSAVEDSVPCDTATIDGNLFTFKGVADTAEFCQLDFVAPEGATPAPIPWGAMFILENGEINLDVVTTHQGSGTPLNEAYNQWTAGQKEVADLNEQLGRELQEINAQADSLTRDSLFEAMQAQVTDKGISTIQEHLAGHTDDVIGLTIVNSQLFYYILSTDQKAELLDSLGPWLKAQPGVQAWQEKIDGIRATAEGMPYVEIKGEDPDGNPLALSDFFGKGNYVLVDFWASWCGPCRAEIPYIADLNKQLGGKGLTVLGCFVWDKRDNFDTAVEELNITWAQLIDSEGTATKAYGIDGIPHIILFSPDGTILHRNLRGDQMKQIVTKTVKGEE